ncbi:MAG: hypothetical protein V8S42_02290 [Lachnospiraceae bacterium]
MDYPWIRTPADDRSRKTGSVPGVICLAAVLLYSVMALPFTIRSLDLDTQTKAERNLPDQELYQYLRQQSDDFIL